MRVCLGNFLTSLELYKWFATLYLRYSLYDIKLVDPNHEWQCHNAWVLFFNQREVSMYITRRSQA